MRADAHWPSNDASAAYFFGSDISLAPLNLHAEFFVLHKIDGQPFRAVLEERKCSLAIRTKDSSEMQIEYDADKRRSTLESRGLDFEAIVDVFAGFYLVRTDDRKDYGEVRYIMLGALNARPVVAVWTPRGDAVRVISMRIADEEERELYWRERDRSR